MIHAIKIFVHNTLRSVKSFTLNISFFVARIIPKPVWAVGFALEQTLRDATLAVFSFANFKTASAY
ncbi:MAG: hypothetical protein LBH59_07610 [Planctomycetaceae bacterium]|nr:hypothetical protein [Planctomycetaceae bacterium]